MHTIFPAQPIPQKCPAAPDLPKPRVPPSPPDEPPPPPPPLQANMTTCTSSRRSQPEIRPARPPTKRPTDPPVATQVFLPNIQKRPQPHFCWIFYGGYQPLEEESDALGRNDQMEDLPAHAITSSNVSDNIAKASTLSLLDRARFTDHITGSRAALGGLTYRSINHAADIQRSTVRRYVPALSKLRKDLPVWIRAHPYKFIGILGGTTLFVLALASPAILGAVGFSAVGPVAGSIAAGWQATMGSVAAASLFSFLQSAAMGGAAMGLFWGIGVLGGVIAVGVGFASMKRLIGRLVEKFRGPMAAWAQNFKGAVGGLVEKFKGLFGKTKHD
ncbi:hypothetical protein GJ744_002189 [Endocarpon pusillum]|uniref:Uncharacterized protein n=1 Tax=Endocarpon pusillum TaxID=364733 RepID=A0A8H7AB08_9EURO|nr:hypothetical protein GJ744_002189 [Endocarpon pusillum]